MVLDVERGLGLTSTLEAVLRGLGFPEVRESQKGGAELFGPRLVLGLEVDPHAKFDLARCVGLTGDIAERPWGVQSQR